MSAVPRNRLASETSLYLRQHAGNPVDWYPWGPEALAKAKELDRPIFLSVGYSACHWCHVMEHECFENAAIATLMSEHFVCVKVDREERPDLDQIYMTAHHILNRGEGGGWPLSVFLTPTLTPFYAGTYFPPDERYAPQRPSFPRLLQSILSAWRNKREELVDLGKQVTDHLQGMAATTTTKEPLSSDLLSKAARALTRSFDSTHGGFGHAPKFPHSLEVKLLLRLAARSGSKDSPPLTMARLTLDKMARGGMYDQIGGGFHRYSVDAIWLVPHFEKMLYDNALLPQVYVEAFQMTSDPFYMQIAIDTLEYLCLEMTQGKGIFSSQDADSEGVEGKFFVWTEAEIDAVLDAEFAALAKRVYGVTEHGNFEEQNILFRARSDAEDAKRLGLDLATFQNQLSQVNCELYIHRKKRIWPGRDEKVLTAWNALAIAAFAQAGAVLGQPQYIDVAEHVAEFLLTNLRSADGRLLRTWGEEGGAKLPAYLEDYAYLTDALVSLYEATFAPRWIEAALELAKQMIQHFADDAEGGFFYTADDHEELIARTKDLQDGSVPSGNAMAATALIRLAKLTGRAEFLTRAEGTLRAYQSTMADNPMAAGQMLVAYDLFLGPVDEIAVIGRTGDADTTAALAIIRAKFAPNRVVAYHDPTAGDPPTAIPLLAGKPMVEGKVTVYICRDFTCQAPLVGLEAIRLAFSI